MSDSTELRQLPRVVIHQVWANLPVLLVLDLMMVVASIPAGLLFLLGIELPGVFLAGVCLGVAWATTVACTDRVIRGDQTSIGQPLRALRATGVYGARLGAWAGGIEAVTFGTLTLYRANPDQGWLLIPLFVDGTVFMLALVAGSMAFSLAMTDGLRGQRLLWSSLVLVARTPWPVAGTVALLVLVGFALSFFPSIVVLLPAPVALLFSAIADHARSKTRATEGLP